MGIPRFTTIRQHDRANWLAALYLEALERDDQETLGKLWERAETDPKLLEALEQLLAGLAEADEEEDKEEQVDCDRLVAKVKAATAQYLVGPSKTSPQASGPLTIADAAEEFGRDCPPGLPAAAYELNERLRSARDSIPTECGLSEFIRWAEAKYGPAPAEYWKALREASIRLELRRRLAPEYHLAARLAPPPPEKPK